MTSTKTCTKCGVTKPLDEYNQNKNAQDGRRPNCKTCEAERHRRYREANREKLAEYQRRYYEENHEQIAERKRHHYAENREKEAERYRRYREENRDEEVERSRRYRAKHRDYTNQKTNEGARDRQRLTLYAAHRRHSPWTPDDDDMVLNSPMTLFQIAVTLNKTYNQVAARRYTLRKNLTSTEDT